MSDATPPPKVLNNSESTMVSSQQRVTEFEMMDTAVDELKR